MTPPRKFSALPPLISTEASPKAISRRTSYLRVRLEFLPYPHLIPTLFNVALLRLGFPTAPSLEDLTLPVSATRRTVLQKVRGCAYKALPQLVDTGFQVLFHSPPGVLFTFPSQYYALSVTKWYLALGGGPPDFPQGSTCLVVLWILLSLLGFRLRGSHPLRPAFPKPFC